MACQPILGLWYKVPSLALPVVAMRMVGFIVFWRGNTYAVKWQILRNFHRTWFLLVSNFVKHFLKLLTVWAFLRAFEWGNWHESLNASWPFMSLSNFDVVCCKMVENGLSMLLEGYELQHAGNNGRWTWPENRGLGRDGLYNSSFPWAAADRSAVTHFSCGKFE